MIDSTQLLSDCKALVQTLEVDLRERVDRSPELRGELMREHSEAMAAGRTRRTLEEWERERITQGAVAWVLGCVFVRFLEDTGLVETPRLGGSGDRLRQSREQQAHFFREHPALTAREYLVDTFRSVAALPGCAGLFDETTNPLFVLPISGDAASELVERWRAIEPESGELVHDFSDPARSTRFLGDLYQDLSETAKKQYALLQTPVFVEEFILDRTLEPAIDEFGLVETRLIDPACGSGHFLLGAFARLLAHWREREPGTDVRTLVERSLTAISGVDLNPFAAEIARFRLLVAAVHACDVTRLRNAPDLRPDIAVGDSLLHGTRPGQLFPDANLAGAGSEHLYATEDAEAISRILDRRYHVVVSNPPYVTPKDAALNEAYRARFSACSGKYALTVPFMQLLFDLAIEGNEPAKAGYVGQVTGNSFMKREFGTRVITDHLAFRDLTLVVDTSGAFIPGHGTPTVILIGRNRHPIADTVRVVMSIRSEPAAPDNPAHGLVWSAILQQVDSPGSESEYISVEDMPRVRLRHHPWTLGGGGASDLTARLSRGRRPLASLCESIGFGAIAGSDEVFDRGHGGSDRLIETEASRVLVAGDGVRDWCLATQEVIAPLTHDGKPLKWAPSSYWSRRLWPYRTTHKQIIGEREPWWVWYSWSIQKLAVPQSIAFAFVATHNHFVYDGGGKVFNRSAPIIKFSAQTTKLEHIDCLGILNSSVACFWLKQVCTPKGGSGIGRGIQPERWMERIEHDCANVGQLPLPDQLTAKAAGMLQELGEQSRSLLSEPELSRESLRRAQEREEVARKKMITLQEELDWEVYRLYGLIDEDLTFHEGDLPEISTGERAFEIVLARRVAAGNERTAWFDRHGSAPITEIPNRWPTSYQRVVERRIATIETNRDIRLIERPEYKRRWQRESWEKKQEHALRGWLLDRLEDARYWGGDPRVTSCARLADEARKDPEFRSVAEVYSGRPDVDLGSLVEELVAEEAVPYLAALRHTDSGMRTRATWERTWELQRREDAIDALCELPDEDPRQLNEKQANARKKAEVGVIPVPPKLTPKDYRKTTYWQLRGKLDVPKERFILYSGAERAADPSPVIGWAGWNHLERAQALAEHLTRMRQEEGWDAERLTPLLAGLAELLPWVLQWDNEHDPSLGRRVGDAYVDFLRQQLAELGLTEGELRAWRPAEPTRGRRRRVAAA